MNKKLIYILPAIALLCSCNNTPESEKGQITFQEVKQVKVTDSFWAPRLQQWSTTTANDVFDKFESKHLSDPKEQQKQNTFVNFDDVAQGKSGTGHHAGLPWFDGLIYESIRGVSDLLAANPNPQMESRIDGYIDRIYAAQQTDPNGYINTWTELIEPNHRWGDNGGFLRFQHDIYNAGMLIEAGIHYYQATGKAKLLEIATRFANHMSNLMGPAPKKNIVPSHSGPEEAMIKLYWLYKNDPEAKKKVNIPVNEKDYYDLVTFWIENRGNHCGYPLWLSWGNEKAEQWIKDEKYKQADFGENSRPTWGDYAQDSISVFEQKTIEGHAVRATLLATAIAAVGLENQSPKYRQTASDLWDNMVGKRMFVTGGVGAIHHDEKFGPDYFLPTDAYLETCAAVGAGFFSQRMNELTGDGKYMDELERALYNNVLTGISLSGDKYTYQNPLNAHKHERWEWHTCPCCPPMFLKIMSAVPGYIYSHEANNIYINLFIGSKTDIQLEKGNTVELKQETNYPWDGKITIAINPEREETFAVKVRIPGWAQRKENPYDLYTSNLQSATIVKVNGEPQELKVINGYSEINRSWKKGDKVELELPMQPRIITANKEVKDLENMVAIASGPIVYCLEGVDNHNLDNLKLDTSFTMNTFYQKDLLQGINVVTGSAVNENGEKVAVSAVPYYAAGNRKSEGYKVWIPIQR